MDTVCLPAVATLWSEKASNVCKLDNSVWLTRRGVSHPITNQTMANPESRLHGAEKGDVPLLRSGPRVSRKRDVAHSSQRGGRNFGCCSSAVEGCQVVRQVKDNQSHTFESGFVASRDEPVHCLLPCMTVSSEAMIDLASLESCTSAIELRFDGHLIEFITRVVDSLDGSFIERM